MARLLIAVLLLGSTSLCFADGPGTRLRTGPGPAQPIGPVERDSQRCDRLQGNAKERCMKELRAAMRGPQREPHQGPGPESTGAGAGASASTRQGD